MSSEAETIKRRVGRPRKIVDEKRVIELASKGLTVQEIAAFENVSHDTITRHCASALERGRLLCDGQIRKKQIDLALEGKGNPIMLIWLGKNRLNQADKQEIDVHRQTTVRMVVGIEQNELSSLTNGYLPVDELKELPQNRVQTGLSSDRGMAITGEASAPYDLPIENTLIETSAITQKNSQIET